MIDLRSDTVTRPTPAMRTAMAQAEVGDDVYREDPTVGRLEEKAAELLGMEASLFVPSGTMGNEIAVMIHARPGEEVLLDADSHIMNYELGALAAFGGVMPRAVEGERGFPTAAQLEAAIRSPIYYNCRTQLICLENTQNMQGGGVFPRPRFLEILAMARRRGLAVHLDGARLFNQGVSEIPGLDIYPSQVETNIVIFRTTRITAPELAERLKAEGILCLVIAADRLRMVTHLDVTREHVLKALPAIRRAASS
jgi:threonine aldolase